MAYTDFNYPSKKALKEALAAGQEVSVHQPGPWGPEVEVPNGSCVLEGPHYPQPHKWYASCQVKDGQIVPGTLK